VFPSSVGILLAAALAGNPPGLGNVVQQALPDDAISDTAVQALPPPPQVVVRETYYGNITIDHAAHLRRRSPCVSCHGPGRVSKLEFTPKLAHERCVGCHKEQALGPVRCTGCHVKQEPGPALATGIEIIGQGGAGAATPATAAPKVASVHVAPAAAEGAAVEQGGALAAGEGAPPATRPAPAEGLPRVPWAPADRRTLARVLQLGWSVGTGAGPSLRMSSRTEGIAIVHAFDRVVGAHRSRTIGLLGFGIARPLRGPWRIEAVGLGGFDLVDEPRTAWMPALGARAGLEWSTRGKVLENLQVSVTGVVDVSRHGGGEAGRTLFATVSTGFALPPQ
jgi:hypothetical protein